MKTTALLGMFAAITVGCSSSSSTPAKTSGTPAVAERTESANVTLTTYVDQTKQGSCTGVLISSTAVLTSAHCVAGKSAAYVRAPYATDNNVSWSTNARAQTWSADPVANANSHDVAIVYLDTPIKLAKYPAVSSAKVTDAQSTAFIRRAFTKSGGDKAFVGFKTFARSATTSGLDQNHFGLVHSTSRLDTGGAVYSANGKVVGLVAGQTSGGKVYAARVDSLTSWISKAKSAPPPKAEKKASNAHDAVAPGASHSGMLFLESATPSSASATVSAPSTSCGADGLCASSKADANYGGFSTSGNYEASTGSWAHDLTNDSSGPVFTPSATSADVNQDPVFVPSTTFDPNDTSTSADSSSVFTDDSATTEVASNDEAQPAGDDDDSSNNASSSGDDDDDDGLDYGSQAPVDGSGVGDVFGTGDNQLDPDDF